MKTKPKDESQEEKDLKDIAALTPFTDKELQGPKFASGHMIGGANPLKSASAAPWKDKKEKS